MVETRSGRNSCSGDPPKKRTKKSTKKNSTKVSSEEESMKKEDEVIAAEKEEAKSLKQDEIHDSPPRKKRKSGSDDDHKGVASASEHHKKDKKSKKHDKKRKLASRISVVDSDISLDQTPSSSVQQTKSDDKAVVEKKEKGEKKDTKKTAKAEEKKEEEQRPESPQTQQSSSKGVRIVTPDDVAAADGEKQVPCTPEKQVIKQPPPSAMRTYPRSILTPGRHLSPKNRPANEPGRKSVVFHNVVVREFERLHNGSGGVPVDGAYPLGLGWEHSEDVQKPVSVYEVERTPKRKKDVLPLTEDQRKALLQRLDDTLAEDDADDVVQRVEDEIFQLQRSRLLTPGCRCKEGSCVLGMCPCYAAGLPCLETYCRCKHCVNPYIAEDKTDPQTLALAQQKQRKYAEMATRALQASGGQPVEKDSIGMNDEDDSFVEDDDDDEEEDEDDDALNSTTNTTFDSGSESVDKDDGEDSTDQNGKDEKPNP